MLELESNNIKVLGIFGRLSPDQEKFFDDLESKYSNKPTANNDYDIFRHLTLTYIPNATVGDVKGQIALLKDIKKYLPLQTDVKKCFVKDEESMPGAQHIAVEFDVRQTQDLVEFVKDKCGDAAVATWYVKVVWFVPQTNQRAVIDELKSLGKLEFADFYLVSNKQNDQNTIFTSRGF